MTPFCSDVWFFLKKKHTPRGRGGRNGQICPKHLVYTSVKNRCSKARKYRNKNQQSEQKSIWLNPLSSTNKSTGWHGCWILCSRGSGWSLFRNAIWISKKEVSLLRRKQLSVGGTLTSTHLPQMTMVRIRKIWTHQNQAPVQWYFGKARHRKK